MGLGWVMEVMMVGVCWMAGLRVTVRIGQIHFVVAARRRVSAGASTSIVHVVQIRIAQTIVRVDYVIVDHGRSDASAAVLMMLVVECCRLLRIVVDIFGWCGICSRDSVFDCRRTVEMRMVDLMGVRC